MCAMIEDDRRAEAEECEGIQREAGLAVRRTIPQQKMVAGLMMAARRPS
jgi:hypothetical protein